MVKRWSSDSNEGQLIELAYYDLVCMCEKITKAWNKFNKRMMIWKVEKWSYKISLTKNEMDFYKNLDNITPEHDNWKKDC